LLGQAVDNWRVPIKKITSAEGASYLADLPQALPMATRYLLQEMQLQHPGGTIELRVPPYGAAQLVGGLSHRRGTPPNVVEIDPESFVDLALGKVSWEELDESGKLLASGARALELRNLFPLSRVR
jgi:hypothetical protein